MSSFAFDAINPSIPVNPAETGAKKTIDSGGDFGAVLQDAIQQVSQLQGEASEDVRKVMTGEINDIHSAMIAVQKADVSFQMMLQVRNKIVSAYQEIMKMQI